MTFPIPFRCDAHPTRLDDNGTTGGLRRTQEKTDYFISVFDPGILWDDFGIRSDVVVSLLSPVRHSVA